jgi:hypothetical protein
MLNLKTYEGDSNFCCNIAENISYCHSHLGLYNRCNTKEVMSKMKRNKLFEAYKKPFQNHSIHEAINSPFSLRRLRWVFHPSKQDPSASLSS